MMTNCHLAKAKHSRNSCIEIKAHTCVTVNTDNRLMSNTSLSRELALLSETFDYDLNDLETFQLNAAAASFLPVEDREDLADQISAGFERA